MYCWSKLPSKLKELSIGDANNVRIGIFGEDLVSPSLEGFKRILSSTWGLSRSSWFCHGAGGGRRRPLESFQRLDPHVCAHEGYDSKISLLLPQASHPQIPHHIPLPYISGKKTHSLGGGGEEKGKKNPQFALHNDTRYPANKNTNPEMDLALFPHFSKYKVWIAAPSSHSESCSWSWGWTQQRDDCLSWYLKTGNLDRGFPAACHRLSCSIWTEACGQMAVSCTQAGGILAGRWMELQAGVVVLEVSEWTGRPRGLASSHCWAQLHSWSLPYGLCFDHTAKLPICLYKLSSRESCTGMERTTYIRYVQ